MLLSVARNAFSLIQSVCESWKVALSILRIFFGGLQYDSLWSPGGMVTQYLHVGLVLVCYSQKIKDACLLTVGGKRHVGYLKTLSWMRLSAYLYTYPGQVDRLFNFDLQNCCVSLTPSLRKQREWKKLFFSLFPFSQLLRQLTVQAVHICVHCSTQSST